MTDFAQAAQKGSAPAPRLSIFFPCYNDAGTIASMVALADQAAHSLTDSYEVIVIDDGSSDHSRAILKALEPKYPRLVWIFGAPEEGRVRAAASSPAPHNEVPS